MIGETQAKIIVTGGKLIDPAQGIEAEKDMLIEAGKVAAIDQPGAFARVSDASEVSVKGLVVVPGLIDLHVHLREPGFEWKETVLSGTKAASCGGFTSVCCMPNTDPVNDSLEVTKFILERACQAALCRVYPIGAITVGQKGESLAPFLELHQGGCVAFSDDGRPVSDAAVMRRALEYCRMFCGVLACHEEERSLSIGYAMNEGVLSLKLGLKGMPGACEDIMIARDIELARLTGGRVHLCHVSTERAVTLIRRAKEDGIPVTAEVTPHHFTLDQSAVDGYNTNAKMSMPLRTTKDVVAVLSGLQEGVIDCIASDHAPHEADSKNREFQEASFGILGLQTTVPLTLRKVKEGKLSLRRAVEALTASPQRCFGLPGGTLAPGSTADFTVIDLNQRFTLSEAMIRSKSKNTPFIGSEFQGVAVMTFLGGKKVFSFDQEFKA